MARGLLEGQTYLHSLGITAWQDAIVDDGPQYGRTSRATSRQPAAAS